MHYTLPNSDLAGVLTSNGARGLSWGQAPSGGLGYTIAAQALTSSPADAQTIYFGMLPKAPTTTAGISKIYIKNRYGGYKSSMVTIY